GQLQAVNSAVYPAPLRRRPLLSRRLCLAGVLSTQQHRQGEGGQEDVLSQGRAPCWVSLERIRELRVRDERPVGQRLQEGDQVSLLRVAQVQPPPHPPIDVGVWLDGPAVVVDHLGQRREAAVVHVRPGQLDVAQRRRLELPQVGGDQ